MAPDPQLTWSDVAAALTPWRNYWLGTTGADGAPHAAPVWGVVVDGTWYLYSERDTAKARNLAREPRVVVHLESGDEVLIVHGRVEPVEDLEGRRRVVAAFAAKYADPDDQQYIPDADSAAEVFLALRPASALAWRLADYDDSQRRWRAS